VAVAQENKYWEDSFRVYEKGVAAFKYPHVKDIWQAYLAHFVQRYGGTKLERARDLFRQALNEVSSAMQAIIGAPVPGGTTSAMHDLQRRSILSYSM
jgi:hypothetical protein